MRVLISFFFLLSDIDECLTELHNCDDNAYCNNTIGSYNCTCNKGYEGSGFNCTGTKYFNRQSRAASYFVKEWVVRARFSLIVNESALWVKTQLQNCKIVHLIHENCENHFQIWAGCPFFLLRLEDTSC